MAKIPSKFAQFAGGKSQCYIVKYNFFRRIFISLLHYVENSLHFNLMDLPVNFPQQFLSYFFWRLCQILLFKIPIHDILRYVVAVDTVHTTRL